MPTPTTDHVKTYYDERVEGKLRDFTEINPRIEAGIHTVAEWAPPSPKRILEIGCGIGATTWRMARAWPKAEVVGTDISPLSIQVAKTCFKRENLHYHSGLLQEGDPTEKFDLVLLMDVYEHIAVKDRPALHATIKSFLAEESRVIVTVPTPAILERIGNEDPSALQPIDEDIEIDEIKCLAQETGTEILFYRKLGIWRYGDYAHFVLGRYQVLADIESRQARLRGLPDWKKRLKKLLRPVQSNPCDYVNYLGPDILKQARGGNSNRFSVSPRERRRIASAWIGNTSASQPRSSS